MITNPSSRVEKTIGNSPLQSSHQKGFTLLEVILALSIMSILLGGIFAITQSILSLSQTSIANQNTQRHSDTLEGYFRTLFKDLPRDSIIELEIGDLDYPQLAIRNPGTFYPSANIDRLATYQDIKTVKNRDGLLSLQASWSDKDISGTAPGSDPPEINQTITLIDNLTSIEWEIYSTRDQEWYTTWGFQLPRPSHIRIKYSTTEDQQLHTHTFWIPPKQ